MDRNEFSLRVEALKAAMHQQDYEKAMEIADDLDLRKIRDNNLLSMVADAYEMNHDYERSKDALLTAYENTNAGRQLAYRLCLISIKTKEYDDAKEFYEDFVEMAPRDTGRYILKYKMAKAQGAPIEKQIKILEEYVNIDMEEKWAYELTKLYHMAGDQEKCVDMCDEISLWFSEGKYVLKALELKKKYVPLSAAQKQKYEEGKQKALEEAAKEEMDVIAPSDDIIEIYPTEEELSGEKAEYVDEEEPVEEIIETPQNIGMSQFDTMDIQAVIAEGMKEVELEDENFHEGEGSTKVAEGKIPFKELDKPSDSEQVFKPAGTEEINEAAIKAGDVVEITMESKEEADVSETVAEEKTDVSSEAEVKPEETTEEADAKQEEASVVEEPVIESLDDVQDILKQLQARGILKAETVEQAVTIIEEAGNEENKELDEEFAKIDQGLDEVIMNESEEELDDEIDEEFEERISSTQKIMLSKQDLGEEEEEPEKIEEKIEDEVEEEPEALEEEPEVVEEDSEVPEEEPEVAKEVAEEEPENDETEEEPVSKATIAIPNLKMMREELQNETIAPSEAMEKQEEELYEPVNKAVKAETLNHIPVLDLGFEMPKRDTSQDVGKKELYENIVANSDLGNITDKIPSKEEIENAIREAEKQEQKDTNEGLRATTSLSAAVEVISGTNWRQQGEEEPEAELELPEVEEFMDAPESEDETPELNTTDIPEPNTAEIKMFLENEEEAPSVEAEEETEATAESEEETEAAAESEEATEEAEPENEEEPEMEEVSDEEEPETVEGEGVVEEEGEDATEPEEVTEEESLQEEAEEDSENENNSDADEYDSEYDPEHNSEYDDEEDSEYDDEEDSEYDGEDDSEYDDEDTDEEPDDVSEKEPAIKLTKEEMDVFRHYLNVEGLEDSIRETVEALISEYNPDGKSTEGNVIILGNKKTGKTTLAIEMIKLVNKKRGRRNRKLAKVNAVALNKRGFRNSLSKLIGCDLVVEHAHELGAMTISEIIDCAGMFTDDMLMVLEGDTEGMEKLLETTPRIKEVFNHTIHIREYNIKEWVEYGKRYAEEKGYVMDELASLAFYKAIDDCFGTRKGIKQQHVEEILDKAIAKRSKKLFGAKKNEDGLIILIEKNFR